MSIIIKRSENSQDKLNLTTSAFNSSAQWWLWSYCIPAHPLVFENLHRLYGISKLDWLNLFCRWAKSQKYYCRNLSRNSRTPITRCNSINCYVLIYIQTKSLSFLPSTAFFYCIIIYLRLIISVWLRLFVSNCY